MRKLRSITNTYWLSSFFLWLPNLAVTEGYTLNSSSYIHPDNKNSTVEVSVLIETNLNTVDHVSNSTNITHPDFSYSEDWNRDVQSKEPTLSTESVLYLSGQTSINTSSLVNSNISNVDEVYDFSNSTMNVSSHGSPTVSKSVQLILSGNCSNGTIFTQLFEHLREDIFGPKKNYSKFEASSSSCSETGTVLVSFIFVGLDDDLYLINKTLERIFKEKKVYKASDSYFYLIKFEIVEKLSMKIVDDEINEIDELFLSLIIASASGVSFSIIIWILFLIWHKCHNKEIIPTDQDQTRHVKINLDDYELRKLPRLLPDYIRPEASTNPFSNNNNDMLSNSRTTILPFEDDIVTISARVHGRYSTNGDVSNEDMNPTLFHSFSKI